MRCRLIEAESSAFTWARSFVLWQQRKTLVTSCFWLQDASVCRTFPSPVPALEPISVELTQFA